MSKLEEILKSEVDAEIKEILTEADKKAATIISEAESQASARVAARQKSIEAEFRAAIHQAESAADLTISNARINAKGEIMALLRQKVLQAMEETSAQPDYGEVLQSLSKEAVKVTESAKTIVVHPDDKEKLNGWAQQTGLDLQTDPKIRLGVRIVSSSGIIVENTLPERLQRIWNSLGPEVAKLLWE